jgi:hypothetical protein
LEEAHRRFPEDDVIAYDLGRLCCRLERHDEAFSWIRKAIDLGGFHVEHKAMEDPELRAISKYLRD